MKSQSLSSSFQRNASLGSLVLGVFLLMGPSNQAHAQSSPSNRFTYGTPFTVTVEHASGKTFAQAISSANRQLRAAMISRCPRRSTLVVRSFQFNGIPLSDANGSVASLTLDGNGSFEVQCKTRNTTSRSS